MENLWDFDEGPSNETDETKKRQNDTMAKANLILLVEPIKYAHIQNAKTAKEVWECLQNAFDDSGLLRWVGLLRTTLEGSSSMEEYVNKIITTSHKLQGTLLLAALSADYKAMIMAIESPVSK